jgi:hypothetical protein
MVAALHQQTLIVLEQLHQDPTYGRLRRVGGALTANYLSEFIGAPNGAAAS